MDVQPVLQELFDDSTFVDTNKRFTPKQAVQNRRTPVNQPQKRPAASTRANRHGSTSRIKRARRAPPPTKEGQAVAYDKATIPGARMMYQRRRYYQILCSNIGTPLLCEVLFDSITYRDFRMAAGVTLPQLKYCVVIAIWAGTASVAIDAGYLTDEVPELSLLLKAVKGLYLPTALAKYIEAIGTCKTASGADVAPWLSTRAAMLDRHLGQIDPDTLLMEAGRPIPANYWSTDREWIASWNQSTTRPARIGMQFRHLN